MNSSWQLKKFGECAELIRDTCRPDEIEKAPYIGLEHIEEGTLRLQEIGNSNDVTSIKSQFEPGDILFGKLRPYFRKVVRPSFSGVCSTDIWVVRAKNGIDQGYLFYWMASQEFVDSATQASEGTKMPRAKWDFLERIEKPIPPLPEQLAIARILGTLDGKIELNRQMNQTLEAMAHALFKNWFVDFEPFRGQGMQDSPLGPIPRNWSYISLGNFTSLDKGISYKGKFLSDYGLPMINLGCFLGKGKFSFQNLKYYSGDYSERHLVYPEDIVIANTDITQKREVLGSPAVVPRLDNQSNYLFTHHVYAIRFNKDYQHWKKYVYFTLLQPQFRERATGFATGTTVLALPRDALMDYIIVNPGDKLIKKFNDLMEPLFDLKYANDKQSNTLTVLGDSLLPKLLSGKIRVKNTENSN